MRWSDLPTTLIASAWGFLLFAGVDGLFGIKAQNVPGYPVSGQIVLYAGIPALFLLLLIGSVVLSRRARWFYDFYPFATGVFAFALFPVLMVWGGGCEQRNTPNVRSPPSIAISARLKSGVSRQVGQRPLTGVGQFRLNV
ncbi:hypothetical protein D3Y57_02505 (plasmid) [Sphingomonas paeninsulae]|uniref:Uncharacterized protein n=1 Tax=Sphingomonas paeninsulae TaxID=2319844 RepID=A0A494T6C5_SPHPE|nr:hypothetical protein D3Y57_02505 [Sphingomonas paeninsulae]